MKQHLCFDIESSDFLSEMERVSESFNYDIFIYALIFKNPSSDKMREQIVDINKRIEIMKHEYELLNNYKYVFINSLFTKNNELYSCSLQVYRKVRGTIVSIKNIANYYSDSLPSNKFRGPYRDVQVPLTGYSYVSSGTYMTYMYDEEDCEDEILHKLYESMKQYFDFWKIMVNLCKYIINKVEEVRKNPTYCLYLHQEYRKKWLKRHISSQKYFQLTPDANNTPIIKLYNKHGCVNEHLAQELYHNFNEWEGDILIEKEIEDERKNNGLSHIERLIFGNDIELARQAKTVIENFDELCPKGHKNKLNAKFIAVFMLKYLRTDSCTEKDFINKYFYEFYNGARDHVDYGSINKQKSYMEEETKKEYMAIIDNFVSSTTNTRDIRNINCIKVSI